MRERILAAILVLLISVILIGAKTKTTDSEWWMPEWLTMSRYSPSFEVHDTLSKYGRC